MRPSPRLFSFVGLSNIGNARIAGLTDTLFITTGIRFSTALLDDVPFNLLVKRLRADIYLPLLSNS